MTETATLLVNMAFVVLFAVIGFFLKRTIQTMYDHINGCNERHISAAVVQNEVKNLREMFERELQGIEISINNLRTDIHRDGREYRKPR